jgi:hypothetical protein
MTKQEKIALQQENPTNALAFKEGFFLPRRILKFSSYVFLCLRFIK